MILKKTSQGVNDEVVFSCLLGTGKVVDRGNESRDSGDSQTL